MVESSVESVSKAVVDLTEKELIRVLHVDDEAGFLKSAKQCLELQGAFEVETALTVDEAFVKLKQKAFDAVVSDYQMPEKDGLQFLKELRKKGNAIPFIMFTGKGREEVAMEALNLGADRYFNKIGHPETVYGELAHGIGQVVRSRRADARARELAGLNRLMADVGALFHNLLFSYQKANSEIHGASCDAFVHSTLEFLKEIEEKRSLKLFESENMAKSFSNLSDFFLKAGVVKEFKIARIGSDRYLLRVDGCMWARHIHAELNPKDVTCPLALIAMAVFEKLSGKKVEATKSTYFKEGTETIIKPLESLRAQAKLESNSP